MRVSVILCTRNRPEMVGDCLEALSSQCCDNLEILVVDQSTDDRTERIVSQIVSKDSRIVYIPTSTVGLSRARNIGIARCSGDIVAFTDDDCVPSPEWAESIVRVMEKHPEASAVYGRSLPSNPVPKGERPVAVKGDMEECLYSGRCNPWLVGHGNNMSFRRQVFEQVGVFDEALGPGGILRNCDDADFTYRVLKSGMKLLYSPEPLLYHKQFRFGSERWSLEKDYGIGAGALYLKHAKCGDWLAVKLLLERWIRSGVIHIAYGVCTWQASHIILGWHRILSPLTGIWEARKVPVDRSQGVFTVPAAGGQSDEQDKHFRSCMYS